MSRCKINKEPVYLDFDAVVEICKKRGVIKTNSSISEETGFSLMSISNWKKEAPEVVTMIHHFLKDNYLNFEDLVKESKNMKVMESKNKDKTELSKKIVNLEKQLKNLKKQL